MSAARISSRSSACVSGRTSTARARTVHVTAAASTQGSGKASSNVVVLGASGYTGSEIVRLLHLHPHLKITGMTAEANAGRPFEEVYPQHVGLDLPLLVKTADADYTDVDAVFCCLPHGTTQQIVRDLPSSVKVVDLSADFRLRDVDTYAEWYGGAHQAVELQKEVVYGLPELNREAVKGARVVANPGCYPTSIQLPLVPLLKAKQILAEDIIIDAKSGVSGAGRAGKVANLYTEVAEGIHSYGVGSHRHMPEIEQELSVAAGLPVAISFTPHLMPIARGMQSTIYVKLTPGTSVDDLRATLQAQYATEPFVRVLPAGQVPHTRYVRGSNHCHIAVFQDRLAGRAIIISVIDNLVKGASGQALQNMNLILGYPEDLGLNQQPMFP